MIYLAAAGDIITNMCTPPRVSEMLSRHLRYNINVYGCCYNRQRKSIHVKPEKKKTCTCIERKYDKAEGLKFVIKFVKWCISSKNSGISDCVRFYVLRSFPLKGWVRNHTSSTVTILKLQQLGHELRSWKSVLKYAGSHKLKHAELYVKQE